MFPLMKMQFAQYDPFSNTYTPTNYCIFPLQYISISIAKFEQTTRDTCPFIHPSYTRYFPISSTHYISIILNILVKLYSPIIFLFIVEPWVVGLVGFSQVIFSGCI